MPLTRHDPGEKCERRGTDGVHNLFIDRLSALCIPGYRVEQSSWKRFYFDSMPSCKRRGKHILHGLVLSGQYSTPTSLIEQAAQHVMDGVASPITYSNRFHDTLHCPNWPFSSTTTILTALLPSMSTPILLQKEPSDSAVVGRSKSPMVCLLLVKPRQTKIGSTTNHTQQGYIYRRLLTWCVAV
jgi:hypothetical protein